MFAQTISGHLNHLYPFTRFIGEEESEVNGIKKLTDDPTWIIDPIDGTANFVRGLKITCVSIGLVIKKVQTLGIVYNPFLDELYTAIRGQGAFLNGKRISTSGQTGEFTSKLWIMALFTPCAHV